MTVLTTDKWRVFFEVGALCGHPEPADFANAMIAPPCAHPGPWFFDDEEVCPEPCGQKHWWCTAWLRPMRPNCPILDDGQRRVNAVVSNQRTRYRKTRDASHR